MEMNNSNQRQSKTNVQEKLKNNHKFDERNQEDVQVDDRMYKILLMNNDNTSVEAVLDVLAEVFGHGDDISMKIMMDAHRNGRAMVWIDTQQNCEAKITEARVYCGQLNGESMEGVAGENGQNRSHFYIDLEFQMEENEEQ